MQSMKSIFVISALATLAGCSSTGDVMTVGPDTYMVIAQTDFYTGGAAGAQTNALREANAKCLSENKQILVSNSSSSFANRSHIHRITFQCLGKNDSDLRRPTFERTPDVLIQTK